MEDALIAPCGMNCSLYVSYQSLQLDLKKKGFSKSCCPGCLPRQKNCVFLKGSCALLGNELVRFCFECADFPCRRLRDLDKRYRTKCHMSMVENLVEIRDTGMETSSTSRLKNGAAQPAVGWSAATTGCAWLATLKPWSGIRNTAGMKVRRRDGLGSVWDCLPAGGRRIAAPQPTIRY